MRMPGRGWGGVGYRYGFNGKETDNDVKGGGNQQDYGMRIYDPRLGRFLSEDPITKKFPMLTPYQFASNTPIVAVDFDGLEGFRPHAVEAALNIFENKTGIEAMKGDLEAQKAYNVMLSTKMKFGVLQFGLASSIMVGGYSINTLFRITTSPTLFASTSSTMGTIIAKYGPDIANFVYGVTTGDAIEPIPSSTGSQAADAGIAFRKMIQKGDAILDFFGGKASRFKNGISIDPVAEFGMGGFKGTIEQFTELFQGSKFKQIVAENPYGTYNYLNSAASLLEQGGTLTVTGSSNNKYFKRLLNGTLEGGENFTVESKKIIPPRGSTTAGNAIQSEDYYEIVLKRK